MYFLCDILWPKVQSHSDDSHAHATGPHSARALLRLALQCHAFT